MPSRKRLIGNNFMFQQDNHPKNTANTFKTYLERKTLYGILAVLDWPLQSPDLNIVECVWDYLDREKNKRKPKSAAELWQVLKEAWNNLPLDYCRKLQESIADV